MEIDKLAKEYASCNGLYPADSNTYFMRYKEYMKWADELHVKVILLQIKELQEIIEDMEQDIREEDRDY